VRDVDVVAHLAGQVAVTTSVKNPREDFEINALGTFNVLEAARNAPSPPIVMYASTNKVYGGMEDQAIVEEPTRYRYRDLPNGVSESQPLDFHSPYGCSKGAADQYVRDFGRIYNLPVVVFRMSCIAGPRQFGTEDQGWVAHFLYSALQGRPVTIYGDGRQVRDILCVKDLIRAIQSAQQNLSQTAGQIYNVGGGQENTTSLLELMEKIRKLAGVTLNNYMDRTRPGDQLVYITDYTKLRSHTGWKPQITVEQTLKLLHEFWQENQMVTMLKVPDYTEPSWADVPALERAS